MKTFESTSVSLNSSGNYRDSSYSYLGGSSLDYCEYYYAEVHNFLQSLYITTICLGIMALLPNMLFLFTVAIHRQLRQTPLRVFLAALSFIDACLSTCHILMSSRWLLDSTNKIFSHNFYLIYLIGFPFQLMSSLLIVTVTVERYTSIRMLMAKSQSSPGKNTKFVIGFATLKCLVAGFWTNLVFVLSVFLFETWGTQKPDCLESSELVWLRMLPKELYEVIIGYFEFINYGMVALDISAISISVILSLLMYRELKRVPALPRVNGTSEQYFREQRNMTKMVVVNTLVFCLFVLLQDIFRSLIFNPEDLSSRDIKTYLYLIPTLSLLNAGISPIIYNGFGSIYRSAFLNTFSPARCAQSSVGTYV